MLSVRNSCYKSKGKAYSFISGGFAFDIRRPLPTKAGEQFLTVFFLNSYLMLGVLQQGNDDAALKLPFPTFIIMQSQALNALSRGKSEIVVHSNFFSNIGFKVE